MTEPPNRRREILNNALAQRPDPRPKESPWRDLQGLTWQEDLFVSRLDARADIGEACITAGFKSASLARARITGRKLLRKPYVKAELDRRVEAKRRLRAEATKAAIEHSGITQARVAVELGRIAFANLMDYMRIDPVTGDPTLDWSGLTREQAAALMDIAKLFGWITERRENKIVDEFDTMSDEQIEAWLDERAEARVRVRQQSHGPQRRGSIGTLRPTTAARGKPH